MGTSRFRIADRGRQAALGLLAGLLLAACGSGDGGASDALLIDYQRALAERLALEAPDPATPANIGAFPERRERLQAIPETREGMLDVYALRECHITTLVADRNSALGRVAPASQRWRYELELWERLTACQASEVPERLAEADRERLARLTATKIEQLPKASWNGLFGSEEWAKSFSRVSSVLPPDELAPPPAQLDALDYLHDLKLHALSRYPFEPRHQSPPGQGRPGAPRPDPEALEGHLQALQSRPYSAELLRTLMLAEWRLDEASTLLQDALARQDGCAAPEPFSTALSTDLGDTREGARLDAWLDELEAAAETWLRRLAPLFEASSFTPRDEPPPAVAEYRRDWLSLTHETAPLPAFQAARARHQALREALSKRCR